MNVSTAYIAASANRFSGAADTNLEGTVIFGSSNLIAFWDISNGDKGISETLPGHGGSVTCVRVIGNNSFVSADDKGEVRIWNKIASQWTSTLKFVAHKQAISALSVLDDCLATGSSDATVKLWKFSRGGSDIEALQTLSLSGRYPLSLAFARLPQSNSAVLAIGGTDKNIQLWARSETAFVQSAILGGHEDWVRGLSFCPPEADGPLVLASGSQDATIRLWNIESFRKGSISQVSEGLGDDLLDAFEQSLGDFGDEEGGRQISLKRHILSVKTNQENVLFSVTFDALLVGHEAGITSVTWRPPSRNNSTPTLMSTSTDSSLILWSPATVLTDSNDRSSLIWINRQRFGDIGGQRLGGFIGGVWRSDGNQVLAYGWSGSWRRWHCGSTTKETRDEEEIWEEVGAIGGHRGPVKSVNWSPNGSFLISSGVDQTSRIHGAIPSADGSQSWHELARPQIHGYDLLGTVFLDELKFASIADEKVLRIFEAPRRFVDLMEKLRVSHFSENEKHRPMGASVPPLGLSNKADADGNVTVTAPVSRRAYEGELAAVTLWPETEKVFGHGYESIALATSNSRKLIASACKASTLEHAVVRIYDTITWHPIGEPLAGHSLTVTQVAFSPDDKLILTVSRDRSWRLFQQEDNGGYIPMAHESKPHARIIWDCAWAREGDVFATASRDKKVKIWGKAGGSSWFCLSTLNMEEAATAVDFTPFDSLRRRYLAIGLENGEIVLFSNIESETTWKLESTITSDIAHVSQINRLCWHPGSKGQTKREIASCSENGTLRILIVPTD